MRLARWAAAIAVLALCACAGASKDTLTPATAAKPAVTGTATVSWRPPTVTADGAPLSNLAGFKIYYGLAPTQMDEVVLIEDASLTSTEIQNLTPGTWYFGATAIDTTGLESALSNVGSKDIS